MRFNVALEWKQGAGNTPSGQRFRLKRVELVPFSYVVSSYCAEMVICEPLEILDQRLGMGRIADKNYV
jgi:hypothetical protein